MIDHIDDTDTLAREHVEHQEQNANTLSRHPRLALTYTAVHHGQDNVCMKCNRCSRLFALDWLPADSERAAALLIAHAGECADRDRAAKPRDRIHP